MQIIVEGWRSSSDDWMKAQRSAADSLPSLSEAQRAVSRDLGISAEDYARSIYAADLSREAISERLERFGTLLENVMRRCDPGASVLEVKLVTYEGKLRISARANGRNISLQFDEEFVDNLMDSGSAELENQLIRTVDLNLGTMKPARAS